MRSRKRLICTIGIILIVVGLSMLLMGCPAKDERKHVVIEVINPLTGEPLANHTGIDMPYDGQPKILEVKLKTEGKRGKYLTDEDFKNNNLKSHIKLSIYSDGDSDFQTDWPVEPGAYTISITFNYSPGSISGVVDENYYVAMIDFTIQIIE